MIHIDRHYFARISAACLALVVSCSWACTPMPGYRPKTVEERTQAAEVVILGRALLNYGPGSKVIEVSIWLKGDGPKAVLVSGFGSSAVCLNDIHLGNDAVIFGFVDRSTGNVFLSYTGIHDAVDDKASVDQVLAAVGASTSPGR